MCDFLSVISSNLGPISHNCIASERQRKPKLSLVVIVSRGRSKKCVNLWAPKVKRRG